MSWNVKDRWSWTGLWQLRVLRAEGNGSSAVESFPSFYFRLLCSFVRGFAYLKQPMLSLKSSIFLCNQIVVRFSPEEKT